MFCWISREVERGGVPWGVTVRTIAKNDFFQERAWPKLASTSQRAVSLHGWMTADKTAEFELELSRVLQPAALERRGGLSGLFYAAPEQPEPDKRTAVASITSEYWLQQYRLLLKRVSDIAGDEEAMMAFGYASVREFQVGYKLLGDVWVAEICIRPHLLPGDNHLPAAAFFRPCDLVEIDRILLSAKQWVSQIDNQIDIDSEEPEFRLLPLEERAE